jgi:hypothetical protein
MLSWLNGGNRNANALNRNTNVPNRSANEQMKH